MAWLSDTENCLKDVIIACSAAYTSVNCCEELTVSNSVISDVTYRLKKLRNTVEAKGDSLMVSCDELARYVCESGVLAALKSQPDESKQKHLHLFLTTLEETYLNATVSRIREFFHSVREYQDVLNEARKQQSIRPYTYLASRAIIISGSIVLLYGVHRYMLHKYSSAKVLLFGTVMTIGGILYVVKRKYGSAASREQTSKTRQVSVEGIVKVERQLSSCIDQLRQQRVWLVGAKEADTDSLLKVVDNFNQSMKSVLGIHRTWKVDRLRKSYEQY